LLETHRNERCEAVSSREWEQIHERSVSQTGGLYVELEEVYLLAWKLETVCPATVLYSQALCLLSTFHSDGS